MWVSTCFRPFAHGKVKSCFVVEKPDPIALAMRDEIHFITALYRRFRRLKSKLVTYLAVEAMLLQRQCSLVLHERQGRTDLSKFGKGLRRVSAQAAALFAAVRRVKGRR